MAPAVAPASTERRIDDLSGIDHRNHAQNSSLTTQNSRFQAVILSLLQETPLTRRAAEEDLSDLSWYRVRGVRDYGEGVSPYFLDSGVRGGVRGSYYGGSDSASQKRSGYDSVALQERCGYDTPAPSGYNYHQEDFL